MYKSLFQKEWIKIKWVLLAYLAIGIVAILSIASDVHYNIKSYGAIKDWLNIISYHILYFEMLKYIPTILAIVLAVFQFLPESISKRYRLSFHLPIDEKKLLLFNVLVGVMAIVIINFILILGFYIMISCFYPIEIVSFSILTTIPWFMAGIIAYLGTATAISDPNWTQRVIFGIITYFALNLFLQEKSFNQYTSVMGYYAIILVMFSIAILFPGHRLRKGAK